MTARGQFSREQRKVLLAPIKANRVLSLKGQSHLASFDVDAHLNRLFGFEGWDKEVKRLWLIFESSEVRKDRVGWDVCYGCEMRLFIFDANGVQVTFKDDAATGTANNLPSRADAHDFAVKNAVSYALKRCAKDLGDQFGLSLYNKGQTGALVKAVVPYGALAHGVDVSPDDFRPEALEDHDNERSTPLESDEQTFPTDAEQTEQDKLLNADDKIRNNPPTSLALTGSPITEDQLQQLSILQNGMSYDERHAYLSAATGRTITSAKDLTKREASMIIPVLRDEKARG